MSGFERCTPRTETRGVGLAGLVRAAAAVCRRAELLLTTEWVEGVRLTDVSVMRAGSSRTKSSIEACASLHQLLSAGLMHVDPHPGNLFVA